MNIKTISKFFANATILTLKHTRNLFYPPICMHCQQIVENDDHALCDACTSLMVPISINERCPFCFTSSFDPSIEKCCQECFKHPLPIKRIAAVFDYEGPPASLVKHLKYGGQSYIAEWCGAYMALQFVELGWPIPDAIIPMPMPILKQFDRGFNQSALIAESLGKYLNRPVHNVLHKRSTGFSQAGLNLEQRKALHFSTFTIKSHCPKLYDQSLLLVDDVMTTGSSLKCCAETLEGLCPSEIYGLTFCRTI